MRIITVEHEVSGGYGKCEFGGDFWGKEVCKYHAFRTRTHGHNAPPEYRKPKCLLFDCWLDEPYKKCEACRIACMYGGMSESVNGPMNARWWRNSVTNPPTEEDADKSERVLAWYKDAGRTEIVLWRDVEFHYEEFPFWMPMHEPPEAIK